MERVRPAETAIVTFVACFGVVVVLAVAALALLGKAPTEAFHRAGLGVVALGALVATFGEVVA
ncbi:MAG TPA: hypothetical protein VI997_08855 [Candidatus Thermoplasmatota archaeon]|nr:hypothetical protein [Candidatus Thermoplasmatota archaeon]